MSHRNPTTSDAITIRGMKQGEAFDPKILFNEPSDKQGIKCYFSNDFLFKLIDQTQPFTGVGEIRFIPYDVDTKKLREVERKDIFKGRISLTANQLLWAIYVLLSDSNDPAADSPPLLNRNEYTTYLIEKDTIIMFQLIGSYGIKRGWNCAAFLLDTLNKGEKAAPIIDKVLVTCK